MREIIMFNKSFSIILLALLFCIPTTSFGNGAILVWNANSEYDLAGYRLYYTSGHYFTVVDLGNVTELPLEDLNLSEYVNYIIVLTAYDTSNNESAYSAVLQYLANDDISTTDNCPTTYNPSQQDTYPPGGNGVGDACECEGDFNNNGSIDAQDISVFKADCGRNVWVNPCTNAAPCASDFDCNGSVDRYDIRIFLEDTGRNVYSNPCPDHGSGYRCSY